MGRKKKDYSPEKWAGHKASYSEWWAGLSVDEKNKFKDHFEEYRKWNDKRKAGKSPDIYDLRNLRLSQLTDKHIYRIWVFKDVEIK